jgi:hypothetical protein
VPFRTSPHEGNRETDDAYPCIARISDDTRVIDCKDSIQWIVQRRRGKEWRGVSYCRSRDVLIERSMATGDALALLQTLPEWHP